MLTCVRRSSVRIRDLGSVVWGLGLESAIDGLVRGLRRAQLDWWGWWLVGEQGMFMLENGVVGNEQQGRCFGVSGGRMEDRGCCWGVETGLRGGWLIAYVYSPAASF